MRDKNRIWIKVRRCKMKITILCYYVQLYPPSQAVWTDRFMEGKFLRPSSNTSTNLNKSQLVNSVTKFLSLSLSLTHTHTHTHVETVLERLADFQKMKSYMLPNLPNCISMNGIYLPKDKNIKAAREEKNWKHWKQ